MIRFIFCPYCQHATEHKWYGYANGRGKRWQCKRCAFIRLVYKGEGYRPYEKGEIDRYRKRRTGHLHHISTEP